MTKRVRNNKQAKNNVYNSKKTKGNVYNNKNGEPIQKLYIDFNEYPKWTYSYVGHKFTNALKSEDEAARKFYFIINELLGSVEKNFKNILANNDAHSHKLTGEQRNLAVKVVKKIHNLTLEDDANIWELSSDTNKGMCQVFLDTFYST